MRYFAATMILIQVTLAAASGQSEIKNPWQAKLDAVLILGKTEERNVVRDRLILLTKQLTQSLAKHPKDASLRAVLGDTHAYLGQKTETIKYLDQAVDMQPKNAQFVYLRGVIYEQSMQKPDKATADYAKAFELEPQRVDYGLTHTSLLIKLKRTREASVVLSRIERIKGLSAASWINIGADWCAMGQDELGIKAFRRALKLDPTRVNGYANIGQTYQNAGNDKEALKAYQELLKVCPDDWRAVAKTIQLYQALRQIPNRDAAVKRLKKLYDAGKVDQRMYCREQFKHGKNNVSALEYFELEGERAVRYVFHVMDSKTGKSTLRYSLGSYATTNAIARESGSIKKGQRLYHMDCYDRDGNHWTLGMYTDPKQITYDAMRKRLIAALDGKLRPISSTTSKKEE
jgi:tetratricopeptide (TPR) repeat protein